MTSQSKIMFYVGGEDEGGNIVVDLGDYRDLRGGGSFYHNLSRQQCHHGRVLDFHVRELASRLCERNQVIHPDFYDFKRGQVHDYEIGLHVRHGHEDSFVGQIRILLAVAVTTLPSVPSPSLTP
ncbi:hypothetical protein N7495_004436 [Penicillium taxi]|uniref:uncharacterized protein n=1 Tax=Penicillium taxi TaxID=168475 RepID=UPI002545047F|nr:uncharacterized protein N7495_004436 [Penicillium taxi]KAJ5899692.1 hypothetical protein N7495_004436 [Penicillium taxi]